MAWAPIHKRPEDCAGANLVDYADFAARISWDDARAQLDGLPGGGLNIAHEADMSAVDPQADLRGELDIDSMDFLNFITALHGRLGVNLPELDHPKLTTVDGAVACLVEKSRG